MTDFTEANLLAIDSSSADLKLGVTFGGDRIVKSEDRVDRAHGQLLIKKVRELLSSASLEPAHLNGLIVCTGPGSFTGLRIGLAAAKGMAVALDIPVVGVSLFDLAAHRLRTTGQQVRVLAPAAGGEYFMVTVADGRPDLTTAVAVMVADLAEAIGSHPVAGFGPEIHDDLAGVSAPNLSDRLPYDAADLLLLGRERLAATYIPDLAELEPLYLRKSQAEIRFARRQQTKD